MMRPDNPLIVQSDRSLMLHTVIAQYDASGKPAKDEAGRPLTVEHPRFAEARDQLALFAELEKSPDYLHTYRITPVSVWNAAALGVTPDRIEEILEDFSCVPVPRNVLAEVRGWMERYGTTPTAHDMFLDTKRWKGRLLTHDEMVDSVKRDIDHAARLGCTVIRVLVITPPEVVEA
jgi:DNA excision repair protein ERCC-3